MQCMMTYVLCALFFHVAVAATLLRTVSNSDCVTCIEAPTTFACLDSTATSHYCCTSAESGSVTQCNSCGSTSYLASKNKLFCPMPSAQCGTTTTVTVSTGLYFSSLSSFSNGEACVYKIEKTTGSRRTRRCLCRWPWASAWGRACPTTRASAATSASSATTWPRW